MRLKIDGEINHFQQFNKPGERTLKTRHLLLFVTSALLAASANRLAAQPLFSETIASRAIQIQATHAGPPAFVDYDNDGWPDMALLLGFNAAPGKTAEPRPSILFFHNNQGQRFSNETQALHIPQIKANRSLIFADYDNDGDQDLLVFRTGSDLLLRNDQGTFLDVATEAGLADSLLSSGGVWLDADRDGQLDLYMVHLVQKAAGQQLENRLYRNSGADFQFIDATDNSGLGAPLNEPGEYNWLGMGMVAADFSDDGWPDLYVGVQGAANRLFINDGQGRFQDQTTAEIGHTTDARGVAVGDIDNDGDLDLFQINDTPSQLLLPDRPTILLNRGAAVFLDISDGGVGLGENLEDVSMWDAGFVDIDNDGDQDLLLSSGQNALFINDGSGQFSNATEQSGFTFLGDGLSYGDYNRDGFVDVVNNSRSKLRDGLLYTNNSNDNHYLRIELVGVESNRNAIGARLIATTGEQTQTREVIGGLGRFQEEFIAHFGLGEHPQVEHLEIRWPSGQVDLLHNIAADQQIRVIEGTGDYFPIRPNTWIERPAAVLVDGSTTMLAGILRPALFEPTAQITRIEADLSELGGPAAVPLSDLGNGTYRLETTLTLRKPNTLQRLLVRIDQQTSQGPYWSRAMLPLLVAPAADLRIADDALATGWQRNLTRAEATFATDGPVYEGERSAAIAVHREPGNPTWQMEFAAPEPVPALGYSSLRFALHPGNDLRLPESAASFLLDIGRNFDLLIGRRPDGGARVSFNDTLSSIIVDMSRLEWQIVELPLDNFVPDRVLRRFRLKGNFEGTFYIDDVRLVAARPASSPNTAVLEQHQSTSPASFALAQNYPNPFNSGTVIRFNLPQSNEIELAIYNLAGQKVMTLVQGLRQAGTYAINWDGKDERGMILASGVYLYELRAGARIETRKLTLLR